jgi:fumarylacetoacetase
MPPAIDGTHDPKLSSFVESAQEPGGDFPIQNLPLGVFCPAASLGPRGEPRVGCAIGRQVLDLRACAERGLLQGLPTQVLSAAADKVLNALMACPAHERRALRHRLSHLLRAEGGQVTARPHAEAVLVPRSDVEMLLSAAVGDYTDFYASVFHATNVGKMMRPDNPLLPNYKHVPIGYHGRASSLVVSGTAVRRPSGQTEPKDASGLPSFGPSRSLDYELEVGAFVAEGNALGQPIPLAEAERHLFGLVLVNDWSARDVQKWEYQPLGPFLSKSFATTVSPWVVTLDALAPFRVPAFPRPASDPEPLPYLRDEGDRASGGIDLRLSVSLQSQAMREKGLEPVLLSHSNLRVLYWTLAQMLTHHASNGCNLRPGDLLGSGTVSGPEKDERGCLLELTWRGAEPIALPSGETRRFLEDGDEIVFRGHCEREGFARIGFGECRGRVGSVEPGSVRA